MSVKAKAAAVIAGGALSVLSTAAPGHAATTAKQPAKPEIKDSGDGCATSPNITWQDEYNNKYLGIYQAGKANGNWASVYQGTNGCNQHFFAVALGSAGTTGWGRAEEWAFVNVNSNKCLEDRAYETTGHVDQWSCGNQYGANATWAEIPMGAYYRLYDFGNGRSACISADHYWVDWYFLSPGYYINRPNCSWH